MSARCVHTVEAEGRDFSYAARVDDAGRAAGNIEREQICACGARRWIAINGTARRAGSWSGLRYVVSSNSQSIESTHLTRESAASDEQRSDAWEAGP